MAKIWNSLPQHVIESPNIDTFKRRLDRAWKNQPMKYDFEADFEFDHTVPELDPAQETVTEQEEM